MENPKKYKISVESTKVILNSYKTCEKFNKYYVRKTDREVTFNCDKCTFWPPKFFGFACCRLDLYLHKHQ